MNVIERASHDLVDHPVRPPTPISRLERRAAQLRRRRAAIAGVSAAVFVVIVVVGGVVLARVSPATRISTFGPPPGVHGTLELDSGTPFVPPTATDGDQTRVALTMANGDTLELQYPSPLSLAELGFHPATAITWMPTGEPADCCSRTLDIRHGTIADVFAGREPTKTYAGANGQPVSYFTGTDINYLAIQIASWVVAIPDYEGTTAEAANTPMTDEQRATFAANLTGHETADGYLVLTPYPPLALSYPDVPAATFGDGAVAVLYRTCTTPTEPLPDAHGFTLEAQDATTGTWLCYDRIPIVVHATGTQGFQDQVTRGLQVISNHQDAYG